MSFLSHPILLASGVLLLVVGGLLLRWAGRHDLKGMAVDAAWQVARNRSFNVTTDLGARIGELRADASHAGRAKRAAGMAVRHVAAQAASIAGVAAMLIGVALIAVALFWK